MRMSTLFGRTLRDAPSDAESPAHQLVVRAGLARPLLPGGYALLPLGLQALRRIEALVRAELELIGAQELRTPVLQPAEIWMRTWRRAAYGSALLLIERGESRLVVAADHLAALSELAQREIGSYRQLPMLVYQLQTVYHDEPRVRGGLLGLREATTLDLVSLTADGEALEQVFAVVAEALERMLEQCGVAFATAESGDAAGLGAGTAYLVPGLGDDLVVACDACGYRALPMAATLILPESSAVPAPALEEVATPECSTIAALATFMGVPETATAKAVFFDTPERGLVFAVIRGDLDVDADKLRTAANVSALRPATAEQITAAGAVPGYASPVGLTSASAKSAAGVFVIADRSVVAAGPLVAGANRTGYHLRNVVLGRDWQASAVADIALVRAGDPCPRCGAPVLHERAAVLARLARLGPAAETSFLDRDGKPRPLALGHFTLELEKLLQTIVAQHHEDTGIAWPAAVAPFDLQLVRIGKKPELHAAADALYAELTGRRLRVLYDDRDESPGVKFNDADLIGLPRRLLISERLLAEGALELKLRGGEAEKLPHAEALARL